MGGNEEVGEKKNERKRARRKEGSYSQAVFVLDLIVASGTNWP